jgi:hypothetical protein
MPETEKFACQRCTRTDVSKTASGGLRSHAANGKKVAPDNPVCPGAGMDPRGVEHGGGEAPTEAHGGASACRVCKMPYPLTANGRIRSHLARSGRESCAGGSDWPLGVEGISTEPTPQQELDMAVRRAGGAVVEIARLFNDVPSDVATARDESWGFTPPVDHVHTFEYGDDGNGHSGSFCPCGMEEPDNPSEAAAASAPVIVVSSADDFLTGGRPAAVQSADDFLTGTSDEADRTPNYFTSRYDGDCSNCFRHFDSGDLIRSDGDGGWMAQDCCGDEDDQAPAKAKAVAAKPQHTSLQLPVVNGRYRGPHPKTGKKTNWTRTTTFAEAIADSIALDQWKGRMEAMGLAIRPDLLAKVRSIVQGRVPYEVASLARKDLNQIVEDAKLAAGSKDRAKKGTILHKHTEEIESGRRKLADVPEEFRPDVTSYLAKMEAMGFRPVKGMIERSVLTTELATGVVGTFDRVLEVIKPQEPVTLETGRVVQLQVGDFVIGDVKSGATLDFAWGEIEIQLSIYAHGINENGVATIIYDDAGLPHWAWSPLAENSITKVREDIGVVMHMPYGEARCDFFPADLVEGWEGARICERTREYRKVKMPQAPMAVPQAEVEAAPPVEVEAAPPVEVEAVPNRAKEIEARAFQRPTAAQMATGHPSVNGAVNGTPAKVTWEQAFKAVETKAEGSALWKKAVEAGVEATELARLVSLVNLAEPKPEKPVSAPNAAVVVPAAVQQPAAAPVPAQAPPKPTLEDRARAVTTKAEASALFQEMKGNVQQIGMARLNAVVKLAQQALGLV